MKQAATTLFAHSDRIALGLKLPVRNSSVGLHHCKRHIIRKMVITWQAMYTRHYCLQRKRQTVGLYKLPVATRVKKVVREEVAIFQQKK